MKIVHFIYKKYEGWGVIEQDAIKVFKNNPFVQVEYSNKIIPLKKARLLVPALPQKIVLVGLNYKDHAEELGMKLPKEPIIFLKPPTALNAHLQDIKYPKGVRQLDYEAELAIVIRKKARSIPVSKVKQYILGYTCLNDITARDLQKKDGQWTRAKSFDTFCPVGPYLETEIDPDSVTINSYLNGKLKQSSSTSNLIFPVLQLVSFISHIMTLVPGDIISTGTPPGVGRMKRGDTIEISIEGVGTLKNSVI